MKSIKTRLVKNFILVTLASVLILEVILISFVKKYYYNNVEEILKSQIQTSSEFYTRYFSDSSLEDNILENVDVFWKQTSAEVQIINPSGIIIMDSIGYSQGEPVTTLDFKKAIRGQVSSLVGNVPYSKSKVMSVAAPLKNNNEIVGVIRFVTSLEKVNKEIFLIFLSFLLVGSLVIIFAAFISVFLANSIIGPIKEVTSVAEEMAEGDFTVKCKVKDEDEIGKLSEVINYMSDEIVAKDKLKNDFISSVSHELRTPLTAIKGWASILNNGEGITPEIRKEGLEVIEKESDRLTCMVEELLDFSRFVSGRITLSKGSVDIREFMEYLESYINPRALRDKVEFTLYCEENIGIVTMDANRMKQVFINILDNAFKFTPENGSISLVVKKNEEFMEFILKDTGIGISEEELPRVKEKFFKGKTSKSQNGIGLSICDEIVKLHKGEFEIHSKLNEGTTVYIKIPVS